MFEDIGESAKIAIIAIIVLAILALGIFTIQATLYPGWLSIQRNAIEHSKSYIDGRNEKAANLIQKYEEATTNQRKFIVLEICQIKDDLGSNSSNLLSEFAMKYCTGE